MDALPLLIALTAGIAAGAGGRLAAGDGGGMAIHLARGATPDLLADFDGGADAGAGALGFPGAAGRAAFCGAMFKAAPAAAGSGLAAAVSTRSALAPQCEQNFSPANIIPKHDGQATVASRAPQ